MGSILLPCRVLLTAALLTAALVTGAAAAASPPVAATWQQHRVTFNYFGVTTAYSCDGLESQVKRILRFLGARNDIKVRATGCPGPFNAPSHDAWVTAEFSLPVAANSPASDPAAAGTFPAVWTPVKLTPRQPQFLDAGDCELVENMRGLITQNANLRHLDFRTACTPYAADADGFSLTGDALKAATR